MGAGTVEFVLEPDGRFWFLEVNTRLQVEHPVTEAVTGLDLVRLQLLVAEGEPLPAEALDARLSGHAIEARLYAEDVAAGYLPASGIVASFSVPPGEGIRVDSGIEDGSVVSPHYDAMLAKVIAWAPTREEAAGRLATHLAAATVFGVVSNRELLVRGPAPSRLPRRRDGHWVPRPTRCGGAGRTTAERCGASLARARRRPGRPGRTPRRRHGPAVRPVRVAQRHR